MNSKFLKFLKAFIPFNQPAYHRCLILLVRKYKQFADYHSNQIAKNLIDIQFFIF